MLQVFRARLSPSEQQQLARQARGRVNPRSPLSEARQIDMAETEILRGWRFVRIDYLDRGKEKGGQRKFQGIAFGNVAGGVSFCDARQVVT